MGEKYIKKEEGKEVVYERGWLGDTRIGELHENFDGSKETRNTFGPNVNVEGEKQWYSVSNEKKASVNDQKGYFSRGGSPLGFGDEYPTFYPNQSESSSVGGHSGLERTKTSKSSGYSSEGEYSNSAGGSPPSFWGSVIDYLIVGAVAAVILGSFYFSYLDVEKIRMQREQRYGLIRQDQINPPRNARIQEPDSSQLLYPGPPIAGDDLKYSITHSFDVTSSSKPQRVARVNYNGGFLRRKNLMPYLG